MIYVLNAYDILPDKKSVYEQYAAKASEHFAAVNAEVIAAGHNPVRNLAGQARAHFVVVGFPDIASFEALMDALSRDDLHQLREEATTNYLWTIYEPWGFGE